LDEEKLQYFETDGPDQVPLKVPSIHTQKIHAEGILPVFGAACIVLAVTCGTVLAYEESVRKLPQLTLHTPLGLPPSLLAPPPLPVAASSGDSDLQHQECLQESQESPVIRNRNKPFHARRQGSHIHTPQVARGWRRRSGERKRRSSCLDRACVRVRVRACVRVCTRENVRVCACACKRSRKV
jgi:hypothetical protein